MPSTAAPASSRHRSASASKALAPNVTTMAAEPRSANTRAGTSPTAENTPSARGGRMPVAAPTTPRAMGTSASPTSFKVSGMDSRRRSTTGMPCSTRQDRPKSLESAETIHSRKKWTGPMSRFQRAANSEVPPHVEGGQMISAGSPGSAQMSAVMIAGTSIGSSSAARSRTPGRIHQAVTAHRPTPCAHDSSRVAYCRFQPSTSVQ